MSSFGFLSERRWEREFWKEKMRSSELFELKTKMNFSHYGSSPHRSSFVSLNRCHWPCLNLLLSKATFCDTYGNVTLFIWFVNWVLSKFEFWSEFRDDYEMVENEALSVRLHHFWRHCCASRSITWRTDYNREERTWHEWLAWVVIILTQNGRQWWKTLYQVLENKYCILNHTAFFSVCV